MEIARADKRITTIKVALEADQSSALNSEEVGGNTLTVRHNGKATDYVMHLRTVVDGILHASGISDISGPCAFLRTLSMHTSTVISAVASAASCAVDHHQHGLCNDNQITCLCISQKLAPNDSEFLYLLWQCVMQLQGLRAWAQQAWIARSSSQKWTQWHQRLLIGGLVAVCVSSNPSPHRAAS